MNMHPFRAARASALSMLLCAGAIAGPVEGLNTFTSGTPARASEVNANFNAVRTAVDDNHTRIGSLLTRLAALEATVTTLQGTVQAQAASITTLQGTVQSQATTISNLQAQLTNITPLNSVVSSVTLNGVPTVRFSGVNVQVVNGRGATNTSNGAGNIIIGYDTLRSTGTSHCSQGWDPAFASPVDSQAECTAVNGLWQLNHKSGSHYLIVGDQHNYSRWGGVVAGIANGASYDYASVTGGTQNLARGPSSSVVGGSLNTAEGINTTISGGTASYARGLHSSVSGGNGYAYAELSSISGGIDNTANGVGASVSGGLSNQALADVSSISGGQSGEARGVASSISGGDNNEASGASASVSGGINNLAGVINSSVSGGRGNRAGGNAASVSGGENNNASGPSSSVSGGVNRALPVNHGDWQAGDLFREN